MTTGRFITFEGGEGAGKSTQARCLGDALARRGLEVVMSREPGGTPFAEQVRDFILHGGGRAHPGSALAETLLFFAARADHVEHLIRPALARGAWVICDRFTDSTRAYQGAASGIAADVVDALERISVGATRPDLTVILDLPAEAGLGRARARREATGAQTDRDAFEARALAFHERLRRGFLEIARAEPTRCIVIDAGRDVEAIAGDVGAAVRARFGVP